MNRLVIAAAASLLPLVLLFGNSAATAAPTSQPAVQESEVVTVKGIDFQVVVTSVWMAPAPGETTSIALSLKATNHSGNPLKFDLDGALQIILKNDAGETLPISEGVDGLSIRQPPQQLAAGEVITVERPAHLRCAENQSGSAYLVGTVGMGFWRFDNLHPGNYTISMTYESQADAATGIWSGKATTQEVKIKITDAHPAGKARNVSPPR